MKQVLQKAEKIDVITYYRNYFDEGRATKSLEETLKVPNIPLIPIKIEQQKYSDKFK